jgi:DNA-binding MarR family transcriptional regulator
LSSARTKKIPGLEQAPYVGALLRLAHQIVRSRLLEALAEQGLGDINEAYFGLFRYPPIDGMRPAVLAKHLGASKQALNHLLGQLERLGYLERRREDGSRSTTVHLTERGWRVVESNVTTIRELEADWERQLGKRRFADFKAMLRELTGFGDGSPNRDGTS